MVFKDWTDVRQMQKSLPEFLEELGIRAKAPPGTGQAPEAGQPAERTAGGG